MQSRAGLCYPLRNAINRRTPKALSHGLGFQEGHGIDLKGAGAGMSTDNISLEFLAKQAKLQMDEMRLVRKDLGDMMRLLNATYDLTRRVERRETELRDDIELMVKMELGGSLANIQTAIESSLSRIEDSVRTVEKRVETLENKI
jgi:Mg2+ and Co2+ transporter CorA